MHCCRYSSSIMCVRTLAKAARIFTITPANVHRVQPTTTFYGIALCICLCSVLWGMSFLCGRHRLAALAYRRIACQVLRAFGTQAFRFCTPGGVDMTAGARGVWVGSYLLITLVLYTVAVDSTITFTNSKPVNSEEETEHSAPQFAPNLFNK